MMILLCVSVFGVGSVIANTLSVCPHVVADTVTPMTPDEQVFANQLTTPEDRKMFAEQMTTTQRQQVMQMMKESSAMTADQAMQSHKMECGAGK